MCEEGSIIINSINDQDLLSIFVVMGDDDSKYFVDLLLKELNYLSSQNYIDDNDIILELNYLVTEGRNLKYPEYTSFYDIIDTILKEFDVSSNQLLELFTTLNTVYYSYYNNPDYDID